MLATNILPAFVLVVDGLNIKISPNPSLNEFNLEIITTGKEAINVRILHISGRFISENKIAAFKTVKLGAGLKTGTYMVEVRQGNNMKTTRVIKL